MDDDGERRRAVVTGLGVVAPGALGHEELWRRARGGDCCIVAIDRFPTAGYGSSVAGQVSGFVARDYVEHVIVKQTDRHTQMGIAACRMATEDAGLDLSREVPEEVGMVFANVFGGMEFAERELYTQWVQGPERVSAYQSIAWFYAATQGQWSIANGIKGYAKSLVGDRAGGHQALLLALLLVREGRASVVYVGGFEAPLVPYVYRIHERTGLLSPARDPRQAYLPFDAGRSGLVLAEGAAVLLVEERAHALRRGARIYAELAGGATTFGYGDGGGDDPLTRALRGAVRDAGEVAADVAMPEGLAHRDGDVREARALATAFGRPVPLSLPKAGLGHALGAAGALDALWASLMIHHREVLPPSHLRRPDVEVEIPLAERSPTAAGDGPRSVVCVGTGYGGVNAAIVLRRHDDAGCDGTVRREAA